jgi:hypothetical protein
VDQDRAALKAYFETGKVPTQEQFESLIDAGVNKTDDGVSVAPGGGMIGIGDPRPSASLSVRSGVAAPLTGKVRVARDSTAVTGEPGPDATRFRTEVRVGDLIRIEDAVSTVAAVVDDAHLTLDRPHPAGAPDAVVAYVECDPLSVRNESGTPRLLIDRAGNVGIGTATPQSTLDVAGTLTASALRGSGGNITGLQAANIEGVLAQNALPDLNADTITSGTLAVDRLPGIPASLIIGGPNGDLRTVWGRAILYPRSSTLAGWDASAAVSGFVIGLLRVATSEGRTLYELGIGFEDRLLSFNSVEIDAGGVDTHVYPECTAYDLAAEGGRPYEVATDVRFVGLDPAHSFNLLENHYPDSKVRSLVTVRVPADPDQDGDAADATASLAGIRDAMSPFSFAATVVPAWGAPLGSADDLARSLGRQGAGMIAQDAAPVIVAESPKPFVGRPDLLIQLLVRWFPDSTATPTQLAWALSAAGLSAGAAYPHLGDRYRGQVGPPDLVAATSGAFPTPGVRNVITNLQAGGVSAHDAAPQLRPTDPRYADSPLQLGVTLRLSFADTAGTPRDVAAALENAGYQRSDVQAALHQLFPGTAAADLSAAVEAGHPH